MKLSRGILIIVALALTMLMLAACAEDAAPDTSSKNVMLIEDYKVSFSFPPDWEPEADQKPYDLQCSNGRSYASIFVYYKTDLADGETPFALFNMQKNDILSKRENVKEEAEEKIYEVNNKRIKSALFSADISGTKNYYYCNLIEFDEASDVFAWVLFTALPSDSAKMMDQWNEIIASAEWGQD